MPHIRDGDAALDYRDDRARVFPVHVELSADGADADFAAVDDERATRILRHVKQRLTFRELDSAQVVRQFDAHSRPRIELDARAVTEPHRALFAEASPINASLLDEGPEHYGEKRHDACHCGSPYAHDPALARK